jgi:hypothetical protein
MKRISTARMVLLAVVVLALGGLWLKSPVRAAKLRLLFPSLSTGEIEPKVVLVDNYEDGDFQNSLGGSEGCWPGNGGSVDCNMTTLGNQGVLTMTYDVSLPDAYAVAYSDLPDLDMRHLDTVWLVVKGAQGGEPIYLEVRDCSANVPKQVISHSLAAGIGTSDWRAAAIPLREFVDITDWDCIAQLNIIPHNEIGSGQGTIYVDDMRLLPARVLMDDFHNINRGNELGGDSGFWNNALGFITYSYPQGTLRLDYDVITPTAEAIYWTGLLDTNLLQSKNTLSFDVRGSAGSEEIAIEFRDCGLSGETHIPKIKVTDYLPDGISTGWQRVSIPLAAFADGMDWRCVEQINILASSKDWLNSGKDTVFIDDLTVAAASSPVPLIVDHFDDCNPWNALTWPWAAGTDASGSTIDFQLDSTNRRGAKGCGLKIEYDVVGASGTWVYADLKGVDVSDYTHLRFWIKGAAGDEELHVYLQDQSGQRHFYEEIQTTQEWQQVLIPLSFFEPPMDLTQVAQLQIAFEWKPMHGQIYLDDISFIALQTYLPIVLKDYMPVCDDTPPSCSSPFDNYEPNNFRCSSTFGLSSDTPIQSYLCAADDIDDTSLSPISVNLSDMPAGKDYDLYLYYQDAIVAKSDNYGSSNESLSYTPVQPGRYYIRIYPYSGHSLMPYTLRATFE